MVAVCKFESCLSNYWSLVTNFKFLQRTKYNQKKKFGDSSLPCSFPFDKVLIFHSCPSEVQQLSFQSRWDASSAKDAMMNGFGLASNLLSSQKYLGFGSIQKQEYNLQPMLYQHSQTSLFLKFRNISATCLIGYSIAWNWKFWAWSTVSILILYRLLKSWTCPS